MRMFMFVFLFVLFCFKGMFFVCEYRSIKKHYREMTFVDFVFTRDKLIITPDRR